MQVLSVVYPYSGSRVLKVPGVLLASFDCAAAMRSQTPIHRGAATPTIAALLVLSLGALGCSKSETAQARSRDAAVKPVSVSPVHKNSVRRSVDVVGTLAAVDQVTISSEADGRVREVLADLGDLVKAGQVLIRLDSEQVH